MGTVARGNGGARRTTRPAHRLRRATPDCEFGERRFQARKRGECGDRQACRGDLSGRVPRPQLAALQTFPGAPAGAGVAVEINPWPPSPGTEGRGYGREA